MSKLFVTNGHRQIGSYLLVFCSGEADRGSLENLLSAVFWGGGNQKCRGRRGLWGSGKLTNICEFISLPVVIIIQLLNAN